MKRCESARAEFEAAIGCSNDSESDRIRIFADFGKGLICLWSHREEEAIEAWRQEMKLSPRNNLFSLVHYK